MKKVCKTSSGILLLMYVIYLLYLVFFSTYYGRGYFHRSYNFIPFKTIIEYIFCSHNLDATVINIVGNILAFVPMGFLVPITFIKINRFKYIAIVVLVATTSIEVIQFIIGVGTCDIDDVILNCIGGIIGFKIYKVLINKIENNP